MQLANTEIENDLKSGLMRYKDYVTPRMSCCLHDLAGKIGRRPGQHTLFEVVARVTIDLYREISPVVADLLTHVPPEELDSLSVDTVSEAGVIFSEVLNQIKLEITLFDSKDEESNLACMPLEDGRARGAGNGRIAESVVLVGLRLFLC